MKSNNKMRLLTSTRRAALMTMVAVGIGFGGCSKKVVVAEKKPTVKAPSKPEAPKPEALTLNTVWMVQQIKTLRVKASDFGQELPYMDLHTDIASFTGFAGCNRMKGNLVNYNDQLKFSDVITTKMMCTPENRERDFLSALSAANRYEIHDNMLYLFNGKEVQLIFVKK